MSTFANKFGDSQEGVAAYDAALVDTLGGRDPLEVLRDMPRALAAALADFTTLRRANLRLFERATPAERARVGIHSERGEESLERMMQLYAGHDLAHPRQLARIRKAIGA